MWEKQEDSITISFGNYTRNISFNNKTNSLQSKVHNEFIIYPSYMEDSGRDGPAASELITIANQLL